MQPEFIKFSQPDTTISRGCLCCLVSFKSKFYINNAEVQHLTDKIYVVGHKSPDTDSVTSAIAYANLKNAMGMKEAVPAAAGDINDETKFLLDYFKVAYPEKLTDATDKKVILVDHNEMAHGKYRGDHRPPQDRRPCYRQAHILPQ
jgi:nanoRNase/pAp phosphatase (c-di-AMP/oligoRNAs hydrolase)